MFGCGFFLALYTDLGRPPEPSPVNRIISGAQTVVLQSPHRRSAGTVYWQDGTYVPEGLADIDHILRDHRTDDTVAIDLGLIDLLYALQQLLETDQPFHIISGLSGV
ncbi:hypothetical protein C2W62_46390 [Candidatus Entotheonella serta]|nr:hypothetical protein C2W62_46390 [Candidatus Entotheonella serta]